MVKTKEGEKISWSEFFVKWKQGIESLTPIQKLTNEKRGTLLTLLGFLASLIAVIYLREKIGLLSYGLILIFIGSAWSTGVRYLSLRQQLKLLNKIEFDSENYIDLTKKEELNHVG